MADDVGRSSFVLELKLMRIGSLNSRLPLSDTLHDSSSCVNVCRGLVQLPLTGSLLEVTTHTYTGHLGKGYTSHKGQTYEPFAEEGIHFNSSFVSRSAISYGQKLSGGVHCIEESAQYQDAEQGLSKLQQRQRSASHTDSILDLTCLPSFGERILLTAGADGLVKAWK